MAFGPHLLPVAGFAALMTAAAVVDFCRLMIPNRLVAALCILWLVQVESTRGTPAAGAAEALAGAALALAGGAMLFARGLIGGGDVKLFAAASLWAGAGALPRLLMLTTVLGGVLALGFLIAIGQQRIAPPSPGAVPATRGALRVGRTPIPYGVAIAAAALIVTIPRYLG